MFRREKPHSVTTFKSISHFECGERPGKTAALPWAHPVSGEERCSPSDVNRVTGAYWRPAVYLCAGKVGKKTSSHIVCQCLFLGKKEETANNRRLHRAPKPASRRPRTEDERRGVLNPRKEGSFLSSFSASRWKFFYRKDITHGFWLSQKFSH